MKVTKDISSFNELWRNCWAGALDTLKTVSQHDKEDELMELLEELVYDSIDETALNDYLWFERDEILSTLGIEDE